MHKHNLEHSLAFRLTDRTWIQIFKILLRFWGCYARGLHTHILYMLAFDSLYTLADTGFWMWSVVSQQVYMHVHVPKVLFSKDKILRLLPVLQVGRISPCAKAKLFETTTGW